MKRASTLHRLERLDILTSRLKSGDVLTISDIASDIGVSIRTVNRDIELLREQGVPVEADRGRGGGVRLRIDWSIGRINFNYAEAVDLMITLAIAQQMQSPLFMASLDSIRRKIDRSFPPMMKSKVKNLKHRILIAPSASLDVLSGFSIPAKEIAEKLHQAFLMQQNITISYKAKSGEITKRQIEPHLLLLSYPVWYVLAWDGLRDDYRTFRCDRMLKIHAIGNEFKLRPISHFKELMEGIDAI